MYENENCNVSFCIRLYWQHIHAFMHVSMHVRLCRLHATYTHFFFNASKSCAYRLSLYVLFLYLSTLVGNVLSSSVTAARGRRLVEVEEDIKYTLGPQCYPCNNYDLSRTESFVFKMVVIVIYSVFIEIKKRSGKKVFHKALRFLKFLSSCWFFM